MLVFTFFVNTRQLEDRSVDCSVCVCVCVCVCVWCVCACE